MGSTATVDHESQGRVTFAQVYLLLVKEGKIENDQFSRHIKMTELE